MLNIFIYVHRLCISAWGLTAQYNWIHLWLTIPFYSDDLCTEWNHLVLYSPKSNC